MARDGPVLVIAEVKTRTSVRHGHPVESDCSASSTRSDASA